MRSDLTDFWRCLQTGFEVAVASKSPDLLLGVRDGFNRYFQEGLGSKVAITISGHEARELAVGLPNGDAQAVSWSRAQALEIEQKLGAKVQFSVAIQGGVDALEVDGQCRHFVRSWAVVVCPLGESWGSSGSIELPRRALEAGEAGLKARVIGTRRQGGIRSSLTSGLESRRHATSLACFYAVSGLLHEKIQSEPRSPSLGRALV